MGPPICSKKNNLYTIMERRVRVAQGTPDAAR